MRVSISVSQYQTLAQKKKQKKASFVYLHNPQIPLSLACTESTL